MNEDPPPRRGSVGPDAWYYAVGGVAEGPLEQRNLLRLLARGAISSSTPVWRPGMDRWTPAREVEELSELLPPPVEGEGSPGGSGEEGPVGDPAGEDLSEAPLPPLPDEGAMREEASDESAAGWEALGVWGPVAAGAVLVVGAALTAWGLGGISSPTDGGDPTGAAGTAAGPPGIAVLDEERRRVARAHLDALTDSLGRLSARDSLVGLLEDGGFAWTRRTGFAGMERLPDRHVVTHAELMGEALSAAPEEVCAAAVGWRATPEEYWRLLGGLSPEAMASLLGIFRAGVMAELRDRAARPAPDPEAVNTAFAMLGEGLSAAVYDSLLQVLSLDASPLPSESCWAERTLYNRVQQLPDPWRAVLARALVTG